MHRSPVSGASIVRAQHSSLRTVRAHAVVICRRERDGGALVLEGADATLDGALACERGREHLDALIILVHTPVHVLPRDQLAGCHGCESSLGVRFSARRAELC